MLADSLRQNDEGKLSRESLPALESLDVAAFRGPQSTGVQMWFMTLWSVRTQLVPKVQRHGSRRIRSRVIPENRKGLAVRGPGRIERAPEPETPSDSRSVSRRGHVGRPIATFEIVATEKKEEHSKERNRFDRREQPPIDRVVTRDGELRRSSTLLEHPS